MFKLKISFCLLFAFLLVACAGESIGPPGPGSEPGPGPEPGCGEVMDAVCGRGRWEPGKLGPLAWWMADSRFVTLNGSSQVTQWRNRIDGRSGVFIAVSTPPPWVTSSGPAGRSALNFNDVPRMDEDTSGDASGRAFVIDALNGTNVPFTVMLTLRPATGAEQMPLLVWWNTGGSSGITVELDNSGFLHAVRRDASGSFAETVGTIQVGTSLRRVAVVFDGATLSQYVDAQLDDSVPAGGQGALSLNALALGDFAETSSNMHLHEVVVVPRAINYAEWLAYYEYSILQWGRIQPPSFGVAGNAVDGTGDLALPYPDTNAGERIYAAIGIRNLVNAPTTPTGWTLLSQDTNSPSTVLTYERDAVAVGGGEGGGTVTFPIAAGNNCNVGFMFTLRNVTNSATFDGRREGAVATEVDGPGSLPAPTVRPNGYGRLALAVVGINESTSMSFSGASGGTWARAAEALSSVGSNFGLSVHVAALPLPLPITGGSATIAGTDSAICVGSAVVGQ